MIEDNERIVDVKEHDLFESWREHHMYGSKDKQIDMFFLVVYQKRATTRDTVRHIYLLVYWNICRYIAHALFSLYFVSEKTAKLKRLLFTHTQTKTSTFLILCLPPPPPPSLSSSQNFGPVHRAFPP